MKWSLVLALASVCVAACSQSPEKGPLKIAELSPDYLATGISCRDEDDIVLFGEYMEFGSTVGEARVLRLDRGAAVTVFSKVDRRVVAFSERGEGGFAAIVGSSQVRELMLSGDDGKTWEPAPSTPKGIFGLAFLDGKNGFAWSMDFVYLSSDGATSWVESPIPELFRPGTPTPVADSAGRLWVVRRRREQPRSELVRIGPTLSVESRAFSDDRIALMATSDRRVWFVREERGYGRTLISTIAEDENAAKQVAEFNDDLPIHFAARGDMAAIILSNTSLGAYRYLMITTDGGESWSRADLEEDSAYLACVGKNRTLWVVTRKGLWRGHY